MGDFPFSINQIDKKAHVLAMGLVAINEILATFKTYK